MPDSSRGRSLNLFRLSLGALLILAVAIAMFATVQIRIPFSWKLA
jgi:hypothetical protein